MSTLKVNHIIPFSTNEITMVSASLTGSITNADSASYALTASFIPGATSASYVALSNVDGFTNYSSSVNNSISDVRDLIAPAIFTTIPTTLTSSVFQTLIVSGSNFDSEAISYVLDSNGTRRNPTTSARTSAKNITLTFSGSDALSATLDPYSVVVENGSGLSATKTDIFDINESPAWETEAGKLGTIYAGEYITASFFVSASDTDGTQPTYSIVSGALPQGLTFITSSGEITGSSIIPADTGSVVTGSGVNFNFTIDASDNLVSVPRSFFINKKWLDGSTEALAPSSAQTLKNIGITTDGYYYIKPDGNNTYYVYCDFSTDDGGWMLVQRLKNDNQFITNSDFNLQTVDGVTGVPKIDHSNSSGFGATNFTNFLKGVGTKYVRIIPTNYSISGYDGMYFPLGTSTTKQWPGGSSLECNNRSTLVGSSNTSWVVTLYPTYTDAVNGTNSHTGTYASSGHYYPTSYSNSQLFYRGSGNGVRWASSWGSTSGYNNSGEGTVWVKTI